MPPIVSASTWNVGTPERQQETFVILESVWRQSPWPDGLRSYEILTGDDGILFHSTQWRNDEAFRRFQADENSGRDMRVTRIDAAVPGIERIGLRFYHPDQERTFDPDSEPGCLVVVTFDVDGPEQQRHLVDIVLAYQDRLDERDTSPDGAISNRFLLSTDGHQVANHVTFTDEHAHQALVDSQLDSDDELPRQIQALDGVRPQGFRRYRPALHLTAPTTPTTSAASADPTLAT